MGVKSEKINQSEFCSKKADIWKVIFVVTNVIYGYKGVSVPSFSAYTNFSYRSVDLSYNLKTLQK